MHKKILFFALAPVYVPMFLVMHFTFEKWVGLLEK